MPKWSPLKPETDRRLVQGLNEGAEGALAGLYDLYAEPLYDYCLSTVRDAKAAGDIVHDAIIDAGRRAPRMRDRDSLRAWLYGAVRRRSFQYGQGERPLPWGDGGAESKGVLADGDAQEVLDRLDPRDRELVLLTLRHELTGLELATVLGVTSRRAAKRAARARARAEAALAGVAEERCHRCAEEEWSSESGGEWCSEGGDGEEWAAGGGEEACGEIGGKERVGSGRVGVGKVGGGAGVVEGWFGRCSGLCGARTVDLAELLVVPAAAVLPATLRHRVIHTGSDPELSAYRADIAARGGALTPEGMPRQPDAASPMAKRWLGTAGAVAGALVVSMVVLMAFGPELPGTPFIIPFQGHQGHQNQNDPSGLSRRAGKHEKQPTLDGGPSMPSGPGGQVPFLPQPEGRSRSPKPSHRQFPPSSPSTTPSQPTGTLTISASTVQLGAFQRSAQVQLSASGGPVSWSATTSNGAVALSAGTGSLGSGEKYSLTISMHASLVQLPGTAQVMLVDQAGRQHTITVSWSLALL